MTYHNTINQKVITFRIRFGCLNHKTPQEKEDSKILKWSSIFNMCLCLQTRERCSFILLSIPCRYKLSCPKNFLSTTTTVNQFNFWRF